MASEEIKELPYDAEDQGYDMVSDSSMIKRYKDPDGIRYSELWLRKEVWRHTDN